MISLLFFLYYTQKNRLWQEVASKKEKLRKIPPEFAKKITKIKKSHC